MARFVRAVFPILIVLRLADQKDPVMDKLYFYVRRMDKTLQKSKMILDDVGQQTSGVSWRILADLDDTTPNDSDSDFGGIDEIEYGRDNNGDDDSNSKTTLGQRVADLWQKRREKLISDFAVAGWLLSPIPEIYQDASLHMTGSHRTAVDRLLKKMFASEFADDSDELARIMNTFWDEFELFRSKSGHFGTAYIWNANNNDLSLGKSHVWHKKNSYFQTKILGKFACRVCSKIVGMGSAERSWGDVKHLKSAKRSHLSTEAVEKQATIFGSACMEAADLERKKAQENTSGPYQFWDESDFDAQFDMLTELKEAPKIGTRFIKCYFEEWEQEHVLKKDDVSKAKFLNKYGGLEFDDLDDLRVHYTIDSNEMDFRRNIGWCVKAYESEEKDDWTPWSIDKGEALHDCLATYYTKHPEKNVVPLILKDQKEIIADLASLTENTKKGTSSKKTKATSPKKNNKKSAAPPQGCTEPCGHCGVLVQPVHRCDICLRAMHVFCGRTIGDEGYGAPVRCPQCDKKKST